AVEQIIAKIAGEIAPPRASAADKAHAGRYMQQVGQDTDLLKVKIVKFANERRLPEMLAGLSMLGQIRFEVTEHLFYVRTGFGVVTLCKALGFDWFTSEALAIASPYLKNFDQPQLDELHVQFDALSMASAQRMLRFWEGRQSVISAMAQASSA